MNITADASSVNAATWLSEVQFGINDAGGNGFNVFNADATQTYTGPTPITATGATSGAFTSQDSWSLEFFDTFDDDAATADSTTSNVTLEFQEVDLTTDVAGLFGLDLSSGSASSVGEFATGGLLDTYDFTLTSAGVFNASTSADALGFTGADADTELFLLDSTGAVLVGDDDGGAGLFSDTGILNLAAGDYSLVVGAFNTIDNGDGTLTAGGGTGDYALSATFTAVPEPSSLAILGIFGIGLCSRRRR